jgi:hypothetical protein
MVASKGITSVPGFVKIVKLVEKLKGGLTDRTVIT